jgi:hypothetical protein
MLVLLQKVVSIQSLVEQTERVVALTARRIRPEEDHIPASASHQTLETQILAESLDALCMTGFPMRTHSRLPIPPEILPQLYLRICQFSDLRRAYIYTSDVRRIQYILVSNWNQSLSEEDLKRRQEYWECEWI